MNKKKIWIIRICTLVVLLAIAFVMFIVGRGHTIYIDNKTTEYNGETYNAMQKVVVKVGGETVAKLAKRERGMSTCIGQTFKMTLEVTEKKGDDPVIHDITLSIPYDLDGIVINVPAYLAGLPADAYQSEFVPMVDESAEDEEVNTDEFGGLGEI